MRPWKDCLGQLTAAQRQCVGQVVRDHAEELARLFYDTMLADAEARQLLDRATVDSRLHASLVIWLNSLFNAEQDLAECLRLQARAGAGHARIGVNGALVAAGARVLKRTITDRLAALDLPRAELPALFLYVYELFDLALDAMSSAHTADAHRLSRSDEAFRLFFLSRDMKAERERRKSQLLEWAQQLLMTHYWNPASPADDAAGWTGTSQFGMWLQHKASLLFEGAPEVEQIQAVIAQVESDLMPALIRARGTPEFAREVVNQINARVEEVKNLLAQTFDRFNAAEDGRDSVTQLLNQRFFPAVARREIALAHRNQTQLAALLLELDGFAALRDTLGLESIDLVLSQVADILNDTAQAGDFVFRFGDSRFLLLLVEATPQAVQALADKLRERVQAARLRTPMVARSLISACVGIALWDGHPDYQHLVDRASDALRQAQARGPGNSALITSD